MPDNQTPVVEEVKTVTEEVKKAPEAPKPSPAQDLRDIQMLLVNGIFPGQVAPSVVKAYSLLEQMASKVEKDASNEAEFKARQAL